MSQFVRGTGNIKKALKVGMYQEMLVTLEFYHEHEPDRGFSGDMVEKIKANIDDIFENWIYTTLEKLDISYDIKSVDDFDWGSPTETYVTLTIITSQVDTNKLYDALTKAWGPYQYGVDPINQNAGWHKWNVEDIK